MIDSKTIQLKAERLFTRYLIACVQDESIFPLEIPADKQIPERFDQFQNALQTLLQASKQSQGWGYSVELNRVQLRRHGWQEIPTRIVFETETDFLHVIGKQKEALHFKQAVQQLLTLFPNLRPWILKSPLKVIQYTEQWPDIIQVLSYYQQNPRPGIYLREVPLPISTKLIENQEHLLNGLFQTLFPEAMQENAQDFITRWGFRIKPGPFFRLRVLDPALKPALMGLEELALSVQQLKEWPLPGTRIVMIENEMTYFSFPALQDTIAIWGHGNQIQALRHIPWLQKRILYYWGDLDVQGFRILASLRQSFPQLCSFLMDSTTYQRYQTFAIRGTQDTQGPPSQGLTDPEMEVFNDLQTSGLRLEQEHLPQAAIIEALYNINLA